MTSLNPVRAVGLRMLDIQYRERSSLHGGEAAQGSGYLAPRSAFPIPSASSTAIPMNSPAACASVSPSPSGILERPELLIADEPTTALDVTLEAQIVQLLRDLRREMNASILFISHNLGLIAELCDFVVVLYAGEVVEQGTVRDIFHRPQHPYTQALLECDPARIEEIHRELPTISGDVPNLLQNPRRLRSSRRAAPRSSTAAGSSIRPTTPRAPAISRAAICWRRRPMAEPPHG